MNSLKLQRDSLTFAYIAPMNEFTQGQTELWLATLRDKSLRRLLITSVGNVVIDERIPVGYRVRDIVINENSKMYTLLTDEGSIIEIIRETYK